MNVSAPDQHFTGIGGKCLAGHECPEGSSTIHPCDPGYYAAVEGMSACDVCPAGALTVIATIMAVFHKESRKTKTIQ